MKWWILYLYLSTVTGILGFARLRKIAPRYGQTVPSWTRMPGYVLFWVCFLPLILLHRVVQFYRSSR